MRSRKEEVLEISTKNHNEFTAKELVELGYTRIFMSMLEVKDKKRSAKSSVRSSVMLKTRDLK